MNVLTRENEIRLVQSIADDAVAVTHNADFAAAVYSEGSGVMMLMMMMMMMMMMKMMKMKKIASSSDVLIAQCS